MMQLRDYFIKAIESTFILTSYAKLRLTPALAYPCIARVQYHPDSPYSSVIV